MSVLKQLKQRRLFLFHFAIALVAMLLITYVDAQLVGREIINWGKGEPVLGVSHPYHFWVMGALTFFIIAVISGFYGFYTRDYFGMAVLFIVGVVFFAFQIEDVLFFRVQGQNVPNNWTWLWQNKYSGESMSGAEVVMWFNVGVFLTGLLLLTYLVYGRKHIRIRRR